LLGEIVQTKRKITQRLKKINKKKVSVESVQTFAFMLNHIKSNEQTFAHSIKIELSQY